MCFFLKRNDYGGKVNVSFPLSNAFGPGGFYQMRFALAEFVSQKRPTKEPCLEIKNSIFILTSQ